MYVLFIARGYPTKRYKTYGIFEFDQAKALVEQGCKVVYAAVDLRSVRRWRKWGIRKQLINDVNIYEINIPLGRVPKPLLRKTSIMALKILYKKIIRDQGKPDIIHAHFTDQAYAASMLKDATNIPLIVTEHSSQINKENIKDELFKIAKTAYHKADCLIAVSPSLAKEIKKKFYKDSVYIPNIVDLNIFKYKGKRQSESYNFVSVGNLIDTKRMDLLIEAFYEAFGDNSKVTLTIFGEGNKRRILENLIAKYNLGSQVKLMGLCSRKKIAEQLEKSDCFVLASQSETFGVAYIEALAMGVPVIATKCGGPEAFVDESNGLLIDVDNKEQLIEAMQYMYNNINKYNGKDISKNIKEKFSPKSVAKSIIEVYKEVLFLNEKQ